MALCVSSVHGCVVLCDTGVHDFGVSQVFMAVWCLVNQVFMTLWC